MSGQHITQRGCRVELHCVGEVLTSDEVFKRIEQANKEKTTKKKGKKKPIAKNTSASTQSTSKGATTHAGENNESDDVFCEGCE